MPRRPNWPGNSRAGRSTSRWSSTLAAMISLAAVALLLQMWRPATEYTGDATESQVTTAVDTEVDSRARVVRAMSTYAILVVVVLIGQSGNFAGMSKVRPPANVTALLRCGQAGTDAAASSSADSIAAPDAAPTRPERPRPR